MCQCCGQIRYVRAGNRLSAYCKECWADFTKMRYHRLRNGERFTIKMYRRYRRDNGLSVPGKDPMPGPKPGNRPVTLWVCPTCRNNTTRSALGFCNKCRQNWSKWVLIDVRITPSVFWKIQAETLGSDVVRGWFGEPIAGQPRIIQPRARQLLDNMTQEILDMVQKQYQQETGGIG